MSGTHPTPPGPLLVLLLATCCGAIVANLYYAQPIIGLIAPDLGLSGPQASLIVSLTQMGYALGLFFLVPLADLLENRRLILITTGLASFSLLATGLSSQPGSFLLLCTLAGLSTVPVQVLIPLAAHLAPEARRGQVVGNVMSGLLLGILLSRPLSSLVADHLGWRAVFGVAAGLNLAMLALMFRYLPRHQPGHRASYGQLLQSLILLFFRQPLLRQRALYQSLMFACFILFWTVTPLELAGRYQLSQSQIALFALIGALGAVAAPLGGRWADAGHTRTVTVVALLLGSASFLPNLLWPELGVTGLVLTGILLDFAVQLNMVVGQRTIYALDPASRGRLNALYMTVIFCGGALGSALAGGLYSHGGWPLVALLCFGLPLVGLGVFGINAARRA